MHELYIIVSIFVTGGLLSALGLMFLVAVIPAGPLLGNYRVIERATDNDTPDVIVETEIRIVLIKNNF
ncbi:hypothetical protein FACS189426_15090 [Bacteroidia bacterium]|nr:hypothetical protein FACS189426_15090 [Bacteroidia bacterium]GHV70870.1 hypothetical protein FACS189420_3730 [Bacteroidia bacterium]